MSVYYDKYKYNFVEKNLSSIQKGSITDHAFSLLDDPSTVCFYVKFLRNSEASNANKQSMLSRPKRGLMADELGAKEYLNNIHEYHRLISLNHFIDILGDLEENQYVFNSISGLGSLNIKNEGNSTRLGDKGVDITITAYENLEHRCKALADLYREIVWDYKNKRFVLPENMRKFDMEVAIYEYKNIQVSEKIYNYLTEIVEKKEAKTNEVSNTTNNEKEEEEEEKTKFQKFKDNTRTKVNNVVNKTKEGISSAENFLSTNEFFRGTTTSAYAQQQLDAVKSSVSKFGALVSKNDTSNSASAKDNRYDIGQFSPVHVYKLLDCEFKFLEKEDKWTGTVDNKEGTDVDDYDIVINVGDVEIQSSYPTLIATSIGILDVNAFSEEIFQSGSIVSANKYSEKFFGSSEDFVKTQADELKKSNDFSKIDNSFLGQLKKFGINAGQTALDSLLNVTDLGNVLGTIAPTNNNISGLKGFEETNNNESRINNDVYVTPAPLENQDITNVELDNSYSASNISNVEFDEQTSEKSPYNIELNEPDVLNSITGIELKELKNAAGINDIELKSNYTPTDITDVELNTSYTPSAVTNVELDTTYTPTDVTDVELKSDYTPTDVTNVELDTTYTPTDVTDVELKSDYTPTEISDVELKSDYTPSDVTNVELKSDYTPSVVTNVELNTTYTPTNVTDVELKIPEIKSGITSIELKENKTTTEIANVELKETKSNTEIKDVEFNTNVKEIKPEQSVVLKTEYNKESISNVQLVENKNKTTIGTIDFISPKVKNDILDIDLSDDLTQYEAPADIDLEEPDHKTEIIEVEDEEKKVRDIK